MVDEHYKSAARTEYARPKGATARRRRLLMEEGDRQDAGGVSAN